jgi:hypothetical protein
LRKKTHLSPFFFHLSISFPGKDRFSFTLKTHFPL